MKKNNATPHMLTNVALCKPAYQSSLSKWSTQAGATGGTQQWGHDHFGFHTDVEASPWWYVDLMCEYPIDRIVLHNRINGYIDNARTIKVDISTDKKSWTLIHAGLVFFTDGLYGEPFTLPLQGQVKARYVRVSIGEERYFHLFRVEVFSKTRDLSIAENAPPAISPPESIRQSIPVGILGTSNSVNKGYTHALTMESICVQLNASIGSSHSTFIPYRLKQIEGKKISTLILDFYVNEQRAENYGYDFFDLISGIIDYIGSWCAKYDVIPVVLIMPTRWAYKANRELKLPKKLIELCKNKQIPYFDGHQFIESLSRRWKREPQSFFHDDHHLNIFVARCLGTVLSQSIRNLFCRVAEPHLQINKSKVSISKFSHIPVNASKNKALTVRQTSLLKEEFARLSHGEALTIKTEEDVEVVALVINMAQTNGALVIEGGGSLTKRLDNLYYDPEKSLWLVTWSLDSPVMSRNKELSFMCVSSSNLLKFEDNDHREGSEKNASHHNAIVELQGIVVRHAKNIHEVIKVVGIDLNLTNKAYFNMVAPEFTSQ
ncbi:Uncharacterised protein [uncultured Comamonas sp.]|nr:Uncharacterised protein [uncultured Comamonas sp.]